MFSEQIQLGADPAAVKVKRINGTNTTPITTTLSIDPQNNRKLIIAINGLLTGSTDYYVEMAEGAVTDMAGNRFEGILNQYQWTFSTINSSGGTPSVSKAELTGTNKIALTFTSVLDAASVPVPANFYVTVNGAGRAVTDVQINNQILTLTLQSSVVNGQIIKVSYSAGANPIKSLNGISAANFSNRDVANTPDNTIPRQLNATLSGNLVILTFSEELAAISSSAYSQFTVYVDGSSRSVTQVSGSGAIAFITFNGNAVSSGQSVTISYYASSYPLKDLSGNALPTFSSFYVQNGMDTKAPILQSVAAAVNKITLVYDETLNAAILPSISAFYVTVNGAVRAVSSITITGSQVVLTLASTINAGESVYVSYFGGTPALVDNGGNSAPVFSGIPASGSVVSSSPSLNGAIVKGSALNLTFSTPLNGSYIPSSTQFTVKVNNEIRPVASVTINGATVTLNLFTAAVAGEVVKVSYSASGIPIRTLTGGQAASFSEVTAANQTTWADNMNGDFEAAVGGGLSIKVAAAAKVSGYSPAGRTANQYVLSAEKILAAFNTVRTVAGMSPRVEFKVPDSEAAGLVAISLSALEESKKTVSNGSIAIIYKDTSYEIPLSALNFSQLAQMANANSAVGQLLVAIDMNAANIASGLTAALNISSGQMLVSPVSFELSVNSNGQSKTLDTLSSFVTRTIKTAATLDGRQTAVVWLDPQTGKLSYAPTQVTQNNGMSVVTFKRKGNSVYAIVKGAVNYTDVTKHWARNDILLLANKYIVEGSTLTTFAPDKSVTRGEFAMFIAKGLGLNGDKQAASKFKDVNTSTTLAAYIGAASNAGIVQGMTDGTFKPNRTVTREEMASMMIRAAGAAGTQISLTQNAATTLKKFKDNSKIGTWAQSDTAKAVQIGVINGLSNGTFGGKTAASRAEAAVMIKRLLVYLNFLDV